MSQIDNIREGLARLATTVETIANTQAAEMPPAVVNSISGNAIHGGKITLLRSTGITDKATRNSLLVEDDLITVGSIDTDNLIGDVDVSGGLNVQGSLTVGSLHVEELSSTQKVTQNIDFTAQGGTIDMMGMQWRQEGQATKQIVWRGDRFYISNTIDLHRNAVIEIDNIENLVNEVDNMNDSNNINQGESDNKLNFDELGLDFVGSAVFRMYDYKKLKVPSLLNTKI